MKGHEHFGFLDGISNPGLRGMIKPSNGGPNHYLMPRTMDPSFQGYNNYGKPGQRLMWPGDIILGLPKNRTDSLPTPGDDSFTGPFWAKNGSFLAYRRLKQDVPGFWNCALENAQKSGGQISTEQLAAKLMGRWPSGAPIVRTPTADNPAIGGNALENNAFTYGQVFNAYKAEGMSFPAATNDILGQFCPFGAHLRKVNTRDQSTDQGSEISTFPRRIARRGYSFGVPIKDKFKNDGVERGLQFLCYQANIDEQFEFLLRQWMNSDINPETGGKDMVLSQDPNRQVTVSLPNGSVLTVTTNKPFVIPTGGGYFFIPSMTALKNIFS